MSLSRATDAAIARENANPQGLPEMDLGVFRGDGYADNAEYLSEVTCSGCEETREEQRTCDRCCVTGCPCEITSYRDLCDSWSGGDLCDDCKSEFTCGGRCPDCDPPDPRDF